MSVFDLVKEFKVKRIIKLIREEGKISRSEISEKMNMPQPTVTRIIEDLLSNNILKESGLGLSSGGRRPILLEFNSKSSYSIGIELGRSAVKIGLTDLNGNFLSFRMKESEGEKEVDRLVGFLKEGLRQILNETQIQRSEILGVGVGLPGPLNEENELISPPNFYNQIKIPLRKMLEEGLGFPVIIDNDANAAALAEKWFGKGMHDNSFVYILADVGIGSALILNGEIYRGLNGEAGEIGHSTINVFGQQCTCGNYGCLENYVSIPKIEVEVKNRLKVAQVNERGLFPEQLEKIAFKDVITAYRDGSGLAKQVLEESGDYLGIGTTNLLNILAPEKVIIGGGIGISSPIFTERVQSVIRERALGRSTKNIHVVASDLREGVVLGAAALVINQTFSLFTLINNEKTSQREEF
ncbi:ROK family transcriptional regulator [Sporosarcina jiandibaonis]|uniref:ROK family transcriptional regulator n=1 Tax=Sporosarcina jiandibaonis TaxID=2715535 RepID=UPI00155813B1|nr:ROK family transcriptional regulator [Sporosarcina jiandibaonis]